MGTAIFQFEAELNNLLPPSKRGVCFSHSFKQNPSVKDTIESFGVPHTEVYFIVVNGISVNFSYWLQDGDRIIVYPISTAPQYTQPLQLPIPHPPRFVVDVHLGKLASSLRLLGFDTLYRNNYDDAELAEISATQQRILLSRDRGLLMRKQVSYGYCVRSQNPHTQTREVLQRFNLFLEITPYSRCMRCNGILTFVNKTAILEQIPHQTRQDIEEFNRCSDCGKIYWRGAHSHRLEAFIDAVIA